MQALRRFTTKDTLYFQVYAYNLKEEPDAGADAVMQAQLRQGETLVAASQPQPVKVERKDGVLLPQTNGMPLAGPAGRPLRAARRGDGQARQGDRLARRRLQRGVSAAVTAA